ncbi:hypothetical protein JCM16303_003542 [Sporobolomyces ruberrimus]
MAHSIPGNAIPDLFKGVTFYLHDTIHPQIRLALHELLVKYGATPCPPPPTSTSTDGPTSRRFDLSKLTHLVTDSLDSPEYNLLLKRNEETTNKENSGVVKGKGKLKGVIGGGEDQPGDGKYKIVLPAWVTRSFDLQVLQQSRFYSPDPALFLSSTCICTTGLPISDDLTICSAVEAFGGQWRRELTREVTHLICVSEVGKKYEMAIKFGTELGIAIVLPHWFEESLKLNQLVPMDVYRFPSPPYSTSLRDLSSSKPFAERLTDYWKHRLSTTTTTSTSTSTSSTSTTGESSITAVPTTSTHVILGLGQGLSKTMKERVEDSEKYFRTTTIEGFPSQLQRDLNDSTLGNGKASGTTGKASGSQGGGSSSRLNSTLSAVGGGEDGGVGGTSRRAGTTNGEERRSGKIFEGKRFYLASDLGLSQGIEPAITTKIRGFGGEAWSFGMDGERELGEMERGEERGVGENRNRGRKEKSVSVKASARDNWERRRIAEKRLREADYVVLRNREGWEYWLAYELDISIGTPPWLFYTFANQTATSPLSRLVHYPPPSRDGVPEFKNKTITVSNYTGLAREYVRTLIELLGAKYEGTMGRTTDFVVTASDIGSKCVHAKSWSIPLVTHLWLESCVLSWSLLSPALSPAYTIHSSSIEGTMFPTILGWRNWTKEAIQKWADSDERREEREHGRKGVEELEREEKERNALDAEEGTRDQMENDEEEPVAVVVEKPIATKRGESAKVAREVEKMDVEEPEVEQRPEGTPKDGVEEKKDARPASESPKKQTKNTKEIPVVEIVRQERMKPPSKTYGKGSPATAAPVAPRDEAMDVDENEDVSTKSKAKEAPRARSKSKSTKPPSPASRARARESTPERPAKKTKTSKARAKEDNDSSALTDAEDGQDGEDSSSSSEASPPPSAKAISKHFGQIDAHNLVQPGSKRAAAGKARAALHVAMEDKNQYEQEQKSSARKGGATRRRSSQGRESGSPSKKKKVKAEEPDDEDSEGNESKAEEEEEEEEEEEPEPEPVVKKVRGKAKRASTEDTAEDSMPKKKAKVVNKNLKAAQKEDTTTQEGVISSFDNPPRAKPAPAKSTKLRIISTGLNLDKNSSEIKEMKPLGAVWTEKPQEATHLVVKAFSRTEKLLCCLPYTPFIVTKKWLDACLAAKELVDETPYLLKDKKKESELGDTLEAILARARKRKMLDGRRVYITRGVTPDPALLGRIVSACGGIVGPSDLLKQHKKIVSDPTALVVSSPLDRRDWEKLSSEGVPIYTVEAVFVSAMHQSVERGFTTANRVDPQLSA